MRSRSLQVGQPRGLKKQKPQFAVKPFKRVTVAPPTRQDRLPLKERLHLKAKKGKFR